MNRAALTALALAAFSLLVAGGGHAQNPGPFENLPGRWVGEGRLGFKEGQIETVKCRATYFVSNNGADLRQTIRCATSGAKIEVKSVVFAASGTLSGTWNELTYNLGGALTGEVTERGFRISVNGGDVTANMEVIVFNGQQIVEIQFIDSTLVGLTLVLKKG